MSFRPNVRVPIDNRTYEVADLPEFTVRDDPTSGPSARLNVSLGHEETDGDGNTVFVEDARDNGFALPPAEVGRAMQAVEERVRNGETLRAAMRAELWASAQNIAPDRYPSYAQITED